MPRTSSQPLTEEDEDEFKEDNDGFDDFLQKQENLGTLRVLRTKSQNMKASETLAFTLQRLDFFLKTLHAAKSDYFKMMDTIQAMELEIRMYSQYDVVGQQIYGFFVEMVKCDMPQPIPTRQEVCDFVKQMDALNNVPEVRTFGKQFLEASASEREDMQIPAIVKEKVDATYQDMSGFEEKPIFAMCLKTWKTTYDRKEYGIFGLTWSDCEPYRGSRLPWAALGGWFTEAIDRGIIQGQDIDTECEVPDFLYTISRWALPEFNFRVMRLKSILMSQADDATQMTNKIIATLMTIFMTCGKWMFNKALVFIGYGDTKDDGK